MTTLIQRETGYTFDTLLELQAVVTKTATFKSVGIDLGAVGAGDNEDGVAVFRGDVVIDISALAIDGNDELYDFIIEGSDSLAFTTGDQEELQRLSVGALETLSVDNDVDSDAGRYILPITNHRNTRVYRFIRLNVEHTGATTSITYKAFVGIPKNS